MPCKTGQCSDDISHVVYTVSTGSARGCGLHQCILPMPKKNLAPLFYQANTTPPKLNKDEAKGRNMLLTDICKGSKLKKAAVVNDRSAPIIESKLLI